MNDDKTNIKKEIRNLPQKYMIAINKHRVIQGLEELYYPIENEWVQKNSFVINSARCSYMAIGGSIAMAISRKKAIKIPGDIDLFTDNINQAENFVRKITGYLNNRKNTYYNIRVNNETSHCLEGVIRHYRIAVPFWLHICVMVLNKPVRKFIWNGTQVQYFDDVVAAAKVASKIDGKDRISDVIHTSYKVDLARINIEDDKISMSLDKQVDSLPKKCYT